jgi:hypothetical protein
MARSKWTSRVSLSLDLQLEPAHTLGAHLLSQLLGTRDWAVDAGGGEGDASSRWPTAAQETPCLLAYLGVRDSPSGFTATTRGSSDGSRHSAPCDRGAPDCWARQDLHTDAGCGWRSLDDPSYHHQHVPTAPATGRHLRLEQS